MKSQFCFSPSAFHPALNLTFHSALRLEDFRHGFRMKLKSADPLAALKGVNSPGSEIKAGRSQFLSRVLKGKFQEIWRISFG